MSLALATLIYEWRRYMAAIVALAFSGLLVLAPKSESLFGGGNGVPRRIMPQLYLNPEVVEVADLDGDGGQWTNDPDQGKDLTAVKSDAQNSTDTKPDPDSPPAKADKKRVREWVQIFAIDPYPGSATLPTDYSEQVRVALLEPKAVVVDVSSLKRLGVKLGDRASLNGKTVYVRGTLSGYPNVAQATVVMSRDTLRLLGLASTGQRVGPLMVRIADPGRAEAVRDALNASAHGTYKAWTRDELAAANENSMMKEQFIGVILGFLVIMGGLIGIGITSQTLSGAILANIKEFASLRALGVSMGALRWIVVELSFWIGIAGLGATALMTAAVAVIAQLGGMPLAFPPDKVIAVAIFLQIIAILSGIMALGILKKSQPADLLR
jgi:putative ABC transport system permease protein